MVYMVPHAMISVVGVEVESHIVSFKTKFPIWCNNNCFSYVSFKLIYDTCSINVPYQPLKFMTHTTLSN